MHAEGATWEAIAEWIGHKNSIVTQTMYGKLNLEEIEAGSIV
jgi:hypothetical protein